MYMHASIPAELWRIKNMYLRKAKNHGAEIIIGDHGDVEFKLDTSK